VDEMDVLPVDLGFELRQRVQPRLGPAPVVVGRPIAGELLDRLQLHALRAIVDELFGGQPHRGDASPEILEGLLCDVYVERVDRRSARRLLGGDRRVGPLLFYDVSEPTRLLRSSRSARPGPHLGLTPFPPRVRLSPGLRQPRPGIPQTRSRLAGPGRRLAAVSPRRTKHYDRPALERLRARDRTAS
jgi:hypothetical protein